MTSLSITIDPSTNQIVFEAAVKANILGFEYSQTITKLDIVKELSNSHTGKRLIWYGGNGRTCEWLKAAGVRC